MHNNFITEADPYLHQTNENENQNAQGIGNIAPSKLMAIGHKEQLENE